MKSTLDGINWRLDEAKIWISDLEDKVGKKHLRDLWDNIKSNIGITLVPEVEEREQWIETYLK